MDVMREDECWARGWFDHLERTGLVRRIETWVNLEADSLRVSFRLSNGRESVHEISRHEIAMDGTPALRRWAETVERHLRHEGEPCRASPLQAPPWQSAERDMRLQHRIAMERMRLGQPVWRGMDFAEPRRDPQAEKRAAALFKMTAGEEAFRTLESGGALPIKGSNGTDYTLHKRASYCVERVRDKAKFCAVVPNVPLWDHLLGIKLMVENDEPKFLETANVAGNQSGYLDAAIFGRGMFA